MTHTTLSRQLKSLEEDGLIIRTEFAQIPPRVEYSLSPIGVQFQAVLDQLEIWANLYIKQHKKNNQNPVAPPSLKTTTST